MPGPTEENGTVAEYLREKGAEFGTTTNRPRRCGWLDIVVLRYAMRVNGITQLCLTKLDVLDELKTIRVCTAYDMPYGRVEEYPLDITDATHCEPIYDEIPGWEDDISGITDFEKLPPNAKQYVRYISNLLGVPITMISVGSKRNQTIHLLQPA